MKTLEKFLEATTWGIIFGLLFGMFMGNGLFFWGIEMEHPIYHCVMEYVKPK